MKKTILAALLLGSMASFNVMAENADRLVDKANLAQENVNTMNFRSSMVVNGKEILGQVDFKHEVSLKLKWIEKKDNQVNNTLALVDKKNEANTLYVQGLNGSVLAGQVSDVNAYVASTEVNQEHQVSSTMGQIETGMTYAFMPTLSADKENYAHLYYHIDFSTLDGIQNHVKANSDGQELLSQTPLSHGDVLEGDKMVELGKPIVLEEKGNYQLVVTLNELKS